MTEFQSVIFFDLDNTLIDGPFEEGVWPVVLAELAGKTGLSQDEIYRLIGDENEARQLDTAVSPLVAMDWDDIAATVAQRLGVTLEANVCQLATMHAGQSTVRADGVKI